MFQRSGWAVPALAAFAGASVWVSLGTQAVTSDETMARVVALPPLWLLIGLVAIATIGAVAARVSLATTWPLMICSLVWLPYLPGRIPAAFLLWQGPLEIGIWIAVIAGLAAAWAPSWLLRGSGVALSPRWAPWIAAGAMAACASAGFAAVSSVIPGGDEPHYLVVTQSLLLDGDLRIENNHDRGDYLSYFAGRLRPDFLERGADGEIYSVHAPGLPATLIPAFAVAGYGGAVVAIVLAAAATSALTWHVAWLISASAAGAWIAWAAVFLTVPYFFHTFTIYPDGFGALLTMVGIWGVARIEAGRPVSRAMLFGVGAALALMPWFHTRFSLIAGALGVVLVLRSWKSPNRWPRFVALLGLPILAAAAWLGFFWYFWGTPSPAAPYGAQTNTAVSYLGRGVVGLLFDQQFGLLATAPIYAVAAASWWSLARRRPRLAVELVFIALPYVLTTSTYGMWWGGTSAPARFLVALMPMAALPLACWWPGRSRAWHALALGVLLISVALVLPRAGVDAGRLLYNSRTGFDLTLEWLAQSVDLPLGFPSVHRQSLIGAATTGAMWLLAGVSLAAVARLLGRHSYGIGATWTVLAMSAAILAMSTVTVVWAASDASVITVNRSKVAALAAFRGDWYTTAFRLRPFRVVTAVDWPGLLDLGTTDRAAPAPSDSAMMRVAGLPAGDYDLIGTGGRTPSGEITLTIGRNDPPLARWQLDERPEGMLGLALRLPVDVSSATIRGDSTAKALLTNVRLRPVRVRAPANTDRRRAIRATRYGRTRVFFFDEQAFLEPTGFWTRADGTALLVIDTDAGAPEVRLRVRAGAAATAVDFGVGAWTSHLSLAPGQQEWVTLPPANGANAVQLMVRSGPGFRPSAVDPTSDDVRELAVWIEIP